MMTLLPNILIATIAVLGILIFQRLLLSLIVSSLNNRSDQEKRAAAGDIWRTKKKLDQAHFCAMHYIIILLLKPGEQFMVWPGLYVCV